MLINELLENAGSIDNKMDVVERFKGKIIENIYRTGKFSYHLSEEESAMPCKEDVFYSAPGFLFIDTGRETDTVFLPFHQSDLFVKICDASRSSIDNYLNTQCKPSNIIVYEKTTYGKEFLSDFIGKKIEKVAVVRKTNRKRKFEVYPDEKGILLRFEGEKEGLAIGIELFHGAGMFHVSCIPEKDIGESRSGTPEIVWLD
ncbi:MAG TPA: hypothetical protein ENJ28_00870 [Gammaproteobacteria bacterium]|nr:hypothetical protein [Gammaproteobacteria bacterium]